MTQPATHSNLNAPQLVEHALRRQEGVLTPCGAIRVVTGKRTGRSPNDRFIVKEAQTEASIDWNKVNMPFDADQFESLWRRLGEHLDANESFDAELHVGSDPDYYIPVRIRTETAWHGLFARNMFVRPKHFNPKNKELWEVRNGPGFACDPERDGTNSDGAVIIDFGERRVLLAGMAYAGEMKKAMFAVQNYLLVEHEVLPMHCAANVGEKGDVALFFGLSGTGKTTLSADPTRNLIGDDEHGWGRDTVFNLEGGCYAKCINLRRETEPVIWDAIRFGSIIENVAMDDDSREVDYADDTLTENSRCSYPLEHVERRIIGSRAGEPQSIIFLTCDINGVLPPVSVLSREAAAYHFLSGYTARVGSTELGGASGIEPTFSVCFGAPFFPRSPNIYAELLMKRIDDFGSRVYLVNTGWSGGPGGPGGTGKRFDIPVTRSIIRAIVDSELDSVTLAHLPKLNLSIPNEVAEVNPALLNPRQTWSDKEAYDKQEETLIRQFHENFKKFSSVSKEIIQAGPQLD